MAPLLNPWLLDLELTSWLFWFGSTAEEDDAEEVGWAADGEDDEVCVEVMTVFDADIIEVMTDTWVVGLDDEVDEVDELDEVELDDLEVELDDVELDEELVELELVDVELELVELELVEVDEVLVELELVELEPPWELDPSSSSVSSSPFV